MDREWKGNGKRLETWERVKGSKGSWKKLRNDRQKRQQKYSNITNTHKWQVSGNI